MQLEQVRPTVLGGRLAAESFPKASAPAACTTDAADDKSEIDGFLGRLDPVVAASFTNEQKRALRSLLASRGATRHMVDIRQTLRLFGKRYYLAVFFGRERRLANMRRQVGLKDWMWRYAAYLGLALVVLAPCFGLAYLIRG